jgi:hypothetical protein
VHAQVHESTRIFLAQPLQQVVARMTILRQFRLRW